MSEIKNCPFCGAVSDAVDDGDNHLFHQPGCYLYDRNLVLRGTDTMRWNARVLPPEVERLAKACAGILGRYVSLVDSGDAGFWEAEEVPEVIEARAALAALKGK